MAMRAEFDGVDAYISIPEPSNDSLDVTGQLTIEAWVEAEVIDTYKSIVVKGDAFTEGKINYGLQILGSSAESVADGVLRFFVYNGSYAFRTSTGILPSDGELHHVAVTVDTSLDEVEFFIDGTLTDTFTNFTAALPDSESSLEIGRHRHATLGAYQYWDGRIDEVRISDSIVYTANFTPSAPLSASGAVGLWHMDESVGTSVTDSSGNGNDGTLLGDATWAGPIWGSSLSFDGVDDYVGVPDATSLTPTGNAVSLSAWIYPETINPSGLHMVFGKWNDGDREYELILWNGKLHFYASPNNTNAYKSAVSSTTLSAGAWYHLAGVWDGSYLQVYINGTPDGAPTAFAGPIADSDAMLTIGAQHWNGVWWRFFDGVIKEPCVFDREITPVEIALFSGGLACDQTATISLSPETAFNPVDTDHTVTATISPAVAGIPVVFDVTDGPNVGDTWTDSTDGSGEADFTYTGDGGDGVDTITACIDLDASGTCEEGEHTATAEKTWFENFVTGGGKVNFTSGNTKKAEWTFGGTVFFIESVGLGGQFQIVHHNGDGSALACHFDTFTFLVFSGDPAESPPASHNTADFDAVGTCNDGGTPSIHVTIQDNAEPGKDSDTIKVTGDILIPDPTNGPVTIDGGNFQVHDIDS